MSTDSLTRRSDPSDPRVLLLVENDADRAFLARRLPEDAVVVDPAVGDGHGEGGTPADGDDAGRAADGGDAGRFADADAGGSVGAGPRVPTDGEFDLCLVDEASLPRYGEFLARRKAEAEPVFLPVLLVVRGSNGPVGVVPPVVDEVLVEPVGRAELHLRVGNLLARRRDSRALVGRGGADRDGLDWRSLLGAVPDPAVVAAPDGRLTATNGAFARTFGVDPGTALGSRLPELGFVPAGDGDATGAGADGGGGGGADGSDPGSGDAVDGAGREEWRPLSAPDGDGPRRVALGSGEDGTVARLAPGTVTDGDGTTARVALLRPLAGDGDDHGDDGGHGPAGDGGRGRADDRHLEHVLRFLVHDLRNPIGGARGHVELAAEELAAEGCDSDHLDGVRTMLDRVEGLVADADALARREEGVADPEPVDLAGAVRTACRVAGTEGATLESVGDLGTVDGEQSLVCRSLENLFRNSVEHAGPGVTVRVGRTDRGFYVEDDGPGIDGDRRGAVFDAGVAGDGGNTGLGLAIVEAVAVAHGWGVSVTDGEAGGARFEFVTDPDGR